MTKSNAPSQTQLGELIALSGPQVYLRGPTSNGRKGEDRGISWGWERIGRKKRGGKEKGEEKDELH